MSKPKPRQLTEEDRAELSMGIAQLIATHLKNKGFSVYCSELSEYNRSRRNDVTQDQRLEAHLVAADPNGSHWYIRVHRDDHVSVRHAASCLHKDIEFRIPDLPEEVYKAMLAIQRNLRVSNALGDAGLI